MAMTTSNLEQLRATLSASEQRKNRSLAAYVLGSLPKRPSRTCTGWVQGRHYWRGRRVILPDGTVGSVYGAVRSRVIVRVEDPHSILGFVDHVYNADDLIVYKVPAAVELGKGKRGVKERPSARKTEAARINGRAAPRLGNRARGRPRKRLSPNSGE